MNESAITPALLRAHIAAVEGACAATPGGAHGAAVARVPLGHAGVDAALGGGLGRAQLHEIFAETAEDSGSAGGFAAMVGAVMARPGATLFWLREAVAEARGGCLHAPGLMALGVDPARVVLGVMDDALSLLRVAAEVVRCPDIDVAVIELWRMPRALDLTATRRLALAAQTSGVTALLLRAEAALVPSAAHTRWSVGSVAAAGLEARAPGHPTLNIGLLRQRGGAAGGQWYMEWNRDEAQFREPALSGLVVPPFFGGQVAPRARLRAG
ncbi:MAG: hypothetical protein WC803_02615 [Sphingomonas sp.]|jgi:protein ImuA